MTPTDTGVLVALIDSSDAHHERCTALVQTIAIPLVTTLPCFTEALYLLGRSGGYPGQAALWEYRSAGVIRIASLGEDDLDRAAAFMATYRDTPCDFADASLLALSEREGFTRLLTLDSHFYAYRLAQGQPLEVAPGPLPRG